MSATQDLIAAALTAADELEGQWQRKGWKPLKQAETNLREMCARAMVQPDMGETETYEVSAAEVQFPMPNKTLYGADRTVSGHFYTAAKVRTYGERCRAAGYAAGVAAVGWRDVADELPKEAQEVLFVRGGKTIHGAWIGGIFWHNNQKMAAAKWMPLPAPQSTQPCTGR